MLENELTSQPLIDENLIPRPEVEVSDPEEVVDGDGQKQGVKFKKWQKILLAILVVVLLILSVASVLGFYTYQTAMTLKSQAKEAQTHGQAAYDQFKAQNLPGSEAELKNVETSLNQIKATYNKLSFYRYFPILNNYYADGVHALNAGDSGLQAGLKSISAVTPYADVLGFAGEGTFAGGTAEDRLKLLLQTLDKVTPALDEISADLTKMEAEFSQIDLNRYPESIKGVPVKAKLAQVKEVSHGANNALTKYRPIIERLPEIAGGKGQRKKYLVLFTNDGELRATGGFLTAYSVIFIEDGKVTPDKSDDIYELDKKFTKKIAIPPQLGKYLTTEKYFHLRDMNIDPDFAKSMDTFLANYSTLKSEPQDVDGIIAVDTHVLTKLLEVLGPVEVPGFGTFSAEMTNKGIPQVVQALSEIITRPTPYMRTDRKGILGPMMRALLTKAYSAPKQQWPALFGEGVKLMEARDIQMYFINPDSQQAAEAINVAGKMTAPENSDFLAVVNSNLGGAKSNFFITSEMEQVVEAPENGQIKKTVTITYKNNQKADNCNLEAGLLCLNSTNRDWTRLYLPKGSELIEAQGFNDQAVVSQEDNFTVFEGFFTLEPMSQAKLKIVYTVPYADDKQYRVKLWKQGGIEPVKVLMEVTGGQEELLMDKDLEYQTEW